VVVDREAMEDLEGIRGQPVVGVTEQDVRASGRAAVPSVDPSSTKITSNSAAGKLCPINESRQRRRWRPGL
jgi:hypothetical protein